MARATFHLMSIREVYAGSAAAPQSSYVELQMYAAGQNHVGGHAVTLYNAAGGQIGAFAFPAALPGEGVNQQTILVGDSGVQAAFGVTPDLVNAGFDVPAAGGAACWAESIDCVSWGNFSGSTPPAAGTPADSSGIPDGMAIRRKISAGTCTNLLDGADDTNDSATDFADATPAPLSYATVPVAMSCTPVSPPPSAAIDSKPPAATPSTSASFAFHSVPAGAGFECRLGSEPFEDCDSGSVTYAGPLAEGSHTFQVRASNANGTGAPASYTWTVDHTAPTASITSHPADPSPGTTASFRYSSNEPGSKFECRLKPVEAGFSACATQPKVYSKLADGEYEFEVRATDAAGNVQALPTLFPWTVDNSLADTTPPETSIGTRPPDPSDSSTAAFTYSSSEPGSIFQCKLDESSFAACDPGGITYTGLGAGQHTFQVRAIDPSENVDPSPAGYTFNVVLAPLSSPVPLGATAPASAVVTSPAATVIARHRHRRHRHRHRHHRRRHHRRGPSR
ncbi:MAG TPA: hypothetical protein VLK56_00015 [Solirubrobacterales bacterium]|nr:hypothetical protein [Solirubrobacterales bacterium]